MSVKIAMEQSVQWTDVFRYFKRPRRSWTLFSAFTLIAILVILLPGLVFSLALFAFVSLFLRRNPNPWLIMSEIILITVLFFFIMMYLSVHYIVVIPILISAEIDERSMGIWESMECSRKAVHPHWLKMLLWSLVTSLLLWSCVAIVPIYWVLPILFTASGVQWALLLDRLPHQDGYGTLESDPEIALISE